MEAERSYFPSEYSRLSEVDLSVEQETLDELGLVTETLRNKEAVTVEPGWAPDNLDALLAEEHAHGVTEFRKAFWSKLAASCATSGGRGWAIFNGEEWAGSVATLTDREVLILSFPRRLEMAAVAIHEPLIRLITNEPIVSEDGALSILTEDVTVLENGHVQYLMDVVQMTGEYGSTDHDVTTALADSRSPLFFVKPNGKLVIQNKRELSTPLALVRVIKNAGSFTVYPYGPHEGSAEDYSYGLYRAKEILDSIQDVDPSQAYGRAA